MKNIEVEIGFDEAVEYGKVYAAKMGDRSESDVIKQAILDIYGATHVIASARATNMLIEVTKNMAIRGRRFPSGRT
ncbi:hypothetical protein GGR16_002647 [Chelatococcus caeni]|uniref:Uncharacterized protein n=1 Tax=Chelatococcus caeni TaxID=1348468 RepID=A0A840BYH0_9HYPH|nr:hypothetical protein [Chelatococcus caeni]MBB4017613.1 hypothetical protein [Chelatococcus caeni]